MTKGSVKNSALLIAERVQAYIRDHGLKDGDLLPAIDKMASIFSVSNSTMREALQYLAAAGFISIEQGRGTYVRSPDSTNLFEGPTWSLLINSMTVQEMQETLEGVYSKLMILTAERIPLVELRNMGYLLERMEHAAEKTDYDGFLSLENRLREALSELAKNRLLNEISTALWSSAPFDISNKNMVLFAKQSLEYYQKLYQTLLSGKTLEIDQLATEYVQTITSLGAKQDLVIYYDTLGTGSFGGTFYTLGQGIAKLIGDNARIKLDINVTGGGIDNVKLAQDKKLAIGITQADVAHAAFHGLEGFEFPHENIRLMGCLPGLELQVSTLANSGIKTLEQLKGRPIAVGAHGGASVEVARQVLDHVGLKWKIDYDPKIVSFATSIEMLCNRQVDAVFFLSIGQSPALLELALTCPVSFIELEENLMASLEASHPYWYRSVIAPNTYPNQEKSAKTIGIPTILVTHKDLPEADVHAMTASIFMHTEEIQSLVWPPKVFKLQDAAREIGIPYHSGAEKFFKKYKINFLGNGE